MKMVVVQTPIDTCARPGCGNEFPQLPGKRFCNDKCRNMITGHRAEAYRVKVDHSRICAECSEPYEAADTCRRLCDACQSQANIAKFRYSFVAVDGEGQAGRCMVPECKCRQFKESAYLDVCSCGHRIIAEASQNVPELVTKVIGARMTARTFDRGHEHIYVLLRCGTAPAVTNPDGLDWEESIEYLYSNYRPRDVYVGFFLGYDFTQILKSLPRNKAWQLFSHEGIKKRKWIDAQGVPHYHSVKVVGMRGVWELHMHADRRLAIRPKICKCPGDSHLPKAQRKGSHDQAPWMYVNDAGGFFQTSFLNVINPSKWETPIVTDEEYELIKTGKEARSSATLDDDMLRYNALENGVLARVMEVLAEGLRKASVELSKTSWYGPGQAAQAWLRHVNAPKSEDIIKAVPAMFINLARRSYFGGWFEIMMHGIIPGISYEYDINSAYPAVISKLPCLLHGKYESRTPKTPHEGLPSLPDGAIRLVQAHVWGSSQYIGTMLHREIDGSILRPRQTSGVFWQHELQAAMDAGLIDRIACVHWRTYRPCDCPPPLKGMAKLYDERLKVGKNSPQGKGYRLVYNSAYGKFAQSIGDPPYANPIYASLITAGCRTQILRAIATHPEKAKAVAMVATDGVYFRTPHPSLPISKKLGDWEGGECTAEKCPKRDSGKHDCGEKHRLTLFKPGVYWDDRARQQIAEGKLPVFKARGVNAASFAEVLGDFDQDFKNWNGTMPDDKKDWPARQFKLTFSMVSCKQALFREWGEAGKVSEVFMTHSSYPGEKRTFAEYTGVKQAAASRRVIAGFDGEVYRSRPHYGYAVPSTSMPFPSKPYDKAQGVASMYENGAMDAEMYGITPDGLVKDLWYEALGPRG
jgi:hypothetical protein